MYGMVNEGIKTFIVSNFGEKKWTEICQKANIDTKDFTMLEVYPDELTYNLVGSISETLQMSPEDVLTTYGKYWITYATSVGYEQLLAMFGPDFKTCLKNLNHMHSHMGSFLPNIKAPRFDVTELSENVIHVNYVSERKGLAPFVMGLFQGLSERYKTKITMKYLGENQNAQLFEINMI